MTKTKLPISNVIFKNNEERDIVEEVAKKHALDVLGKKQYNDPKLESAVNGIESDFIDGFIFAKKLFKINSNIS